MSEWLAQAGLITGAAISIGTPVFLATVGETLSQRSGVVNLGLEGAMLAGAATAAAGCYLTGSVWLGVAAGALAGGAVGLSHGLLVVRLGVGMIASGLCLFFIGRGLSAFWAQPLVGQQLPAIPRLRVPVLSDLPFAGVALFSHDMLVYAAALAGLSVWYLLFRTRAGLLIRAAGEDSAVAKAEGVPVRALRVACVTVGSALAGIGGAHITLGFSHTWLEDVTAGRGWVAIGLVVLARWNPLYAFPVAYVFGGVVALQLNAQAAGMGVSPYVLSMLPYLFTVAALTVTHYWARGSGMPAELARTEAGD
jgi:simple sugar transport system permease protein